MAKRTPLPQGITVRCIYCKGTKVLSVEEARALSDPPMCEKDGGVMVAERVRA